MRVNGTGLVAAEKSNHAWDVTIKVMSEHRGTDFFIGYKMKPARSYYKNCRNSCCQVWDVFGMNWHVGTDCMNSYPISPHKKDLLKCTFWMSPGPRRLTWPISLDEKFLSFMCKWDCGNHLKIPKSGSLNLGSSWACGIPKLHVFAISPSFGARFYWIYAYHGPWAFSQIEYDSSKLSFQVSD